MPSFEGVEHEILMPVGPGERRRRAVLRGLVAGGDPGFSFPDLDENTRRGHVLHERHDRQAQGRRLLAPLDGPALAVRHSARRARPREGDPSCRSCRCSTPTPGACPTRAALAGARQVLPGPRWPRRTCPSSSPTEGVTRAAGVPTIWQGILALEDPPTCRLDEAMAGGSAVPESLIRAFDERWGVRRAGVGDDGDESAAGRRAPRRPTLRRDVGARPLRLAPGRAASQPLAAIRIRRGGRRAPGPRPLDRQRLLRRSDLSREVHRGRLAAHGRRRRAGHGPSSSSWTAPRTS